jgi:hypothetical protein
LRDHWNAGCWQPARQFARGLRYMTSAALPARRRRHVCTPEKKRTRSDPMRLDATEHHPKKGVHLYVNRDLVDQVVSRLFAKMTRTKCFEKAIKKLFHGVSVGSHPSFFRWSTTVSMLLDGDGRLANDVPCSKIGGWPLHDISIVFESPRGWIDYGFLVFNSTTRSDKAAKPVYPYLTGQFLVTVRNVVYCYLLRNVKSLSRVIKSRKWSFYT